MARPFVKASDVKVGAKLVPDWCMSDCMTPGTPLEVKECSDGLYLECGEGEHALDGQLEEIDGEECYVGFTLHGAPENGRRSDAP